MKDKLDINLRIGDVTLNLTINRDEEKILRDAAKEVNHAYDEYKKRFGSSSPQEVLAKVTLLFAKGYFTTASQVRELDKVLGDFDARLTELLEQQP